MESDKKNKIIRIVLISLLGIFLLIFFTQNNNPSKIIKDKLNLTLPSTSKIINFRYNRIIGDFDAKILINEQNVTDLKNELYKNFGEEYDITRDSFENLTERKNIDKNNIIVCYKTFADGEKFLFFPSPKCGNVWIFITQQKDGKYYLYISYLS